MGLKQTVLRIDVHADKSSAIHDWEIRTKLIALLTLMFAVAILRDPILLLSALLVCALLYHAARLPLLFLLQYLRWPGFFIAVMVITLVFSNGNTPLLAFGPLTLWQEGVHAAGIIMLRFLAIVMLALILFGSAPFSKSLKGLRTLGIPALLVDMALLAYRYTFEIGADFQRMQRAAGLRGYALCWQSVSQLGALLGSLLDRTGVRSERIYHAMLLRGYGSGLNYAALPGPQRKDYLRLAAVFLFTLVLIIMDITQVPGG